MALYAGIRTDGGRCGAQAMRNSQWCIGHDPDQAEARRKRASKGGRRGGRGRPQTELQEVKTLLATLTARVLKEEGTEPLETGPAAVANQLLNTRLRAIELERKLKETEELEERIAALEQREPNTGGRRYGA
jgi:hypothetical protein